MSITMEALRSTVLAFRDERGWGPRHVPRDLVMGLVSEVGELAEVFLWKDDGAIEALKQPSDERTHLGEELADVMIYLLYLAEHAEIDLAEAVLDKVKKNGIKYPAQ